MSLNVGLDIGTSAVRAALVETRKGKPSLKRFGQVALPPGTVVGGEVVDETVMKDALSQLWKTAKLPKKRVIVGLANQRVIVRRIDLPYMDNEELRESLAFQAQEYIPIPVEEASLDFVPLEEFTTPNGEAMMSILVVAAQKTMTQDVLRIIGSVGAKVMAVDLQAFALVRAAFGPDPDPDGPPVAMVDIGGNVTQVTIVKGGTVRFLRILPMGGDDFTSVLAAELGVSPEQADQLKRRVGVAIEGDGKATGGTQDPESQARAVLTRQANQLIDEVRGSIDYYSSQATDSEVTRLAIAGNGARLPHLANRLGRTLGLQIEPVKLLAGEDFEVSKRVGLSETEFQTAQPVLPVAVGLALWAGE
jgi:type IV pilus assembly protein PilM